MSEYGNIGYAFFFRMLEMIYKTGNGELDLSNPVIFKSIVKKFGESIDVFNEILSCSLEVGLFDKEVFEDKKVLTSNGVKKMLDIVDEKRGKYRSKKEKIELSQEKTEFSPEKTPVIPLEKCINQTKPNQTKLKESKLNQTKENEMKENEMKGEERTDKPNQTRGGAGGASVSQSVNACEKTKFFNYEKLQIDDPEKVLRFIPASRELDLLRQDDYAALLRICRDLEIQLEVGKTVVRDSIGYVVKAIENMLREKTIEDYF